MRDVLVLCYHAVSETWPANLSVTPSRLEEQLGTLVAAGYHGATFTEAVTAPPARKTLAVTFDDGFRSVVEQGLPVLERIGLPGTLFVPTDFVGLRGEPMAWPWIDTWLGGPHERELVGLDWPDVAALAARGWEIGSHTRSHARLPELADGALAAELRESRLACEEHLGRPCRSLAYPYGEVDARVVRAAQDAGYAAAAALRERPHRARRLEWPRVGVSHPHTLEQFRRNTSPVRRRVAVLPAGDRVLTAERKLRKRLRRAGRAR